LITRIINTDTIYAPTWNVFVVEKIDGDWKIVLVSQTNIRE